MQVFVPYREPAKVAACLDSRRLEKQIIECQQILDAINGVGKGWFNHPVVKMYKEHREWLNRYLYCLRNYRQYKKIESESVRRLVLSSIKQHSDWAMEITPPFLTEEFCNQHKRRLYTKNPEFYKDFAEYGKSEENWYFLDGKIVKYVNGEKKIINNK